jgi:hypothetical protein
MSRPSRANRTDGNQSAIVEWLRALPGVSVAVEHDDIIVGYQGRNYWFEVKNPETCFLADGITFTATAIKKSQSKIRATWSGQYEIVWSVEQILKTIEFNRKVIL